MKKYYLLILVVLAGGLFWFYQQKTEEVIQINLPEAVDYQQIITNQQADAELSEAEIVSSTTEIIPPRLSINLAVPFTSQAPTANWEQPWQDACEEASWLMVDYYYQNKTMPTPIAVEAIIQPMVDWQITNWGSHDDLSLAKLAEYIELTSDYQIELIENLTPDKLRDKLQQGQPVIVPADGHKLANPYFSGDGPDYHMLVVKGYVDDNFITNDPGTRRGADFVYTTANLFDSIADWVPGQGTVGPQIGLVVYPN